MSTLYSIAAVTAVLKDLLNNGLIDGDIASTVSDNVVVSALPPDRIDVGNGTERSQLNLFLYRTTLNPGWRNAGLPARDRGGHPVSRDPLVVDLHYILSAYGAEELHSEILLGYAMQLLHEHPVLARESVALALEGPDLVGDEESLPPMLRALAGSALAEQIEMIKITPAGLSIEDMSKVWTSFQVAYRPSVAYTATTVIIESRVQPRTGPPVQTRNIVAVPYSRPVITRLLAETEPGDEPSALAPIHPGSVGVIRGRQLRAERTRLRLGGTTLTPHSENVSDSEIRFTVPPDLAAGMHPLSVLHEVSVGDPVIVRPFAESNPVGLLLRPSIVRLPDDSFDISVSDVELEDGVITLATIALRVIPEVTRRQRIELVLNRTNSPVPASFRFFSDPIDIPEGDASTGEVSFSVSNVEAGDYLVRLSVDGAESVLIPSTDPDDPGYVDPTVTLGP